MSQKEVYHISQTMHKDLGIHMEEFWENEGWSLFFVFLQTLEISLDIILSTRPDFSISSVPAGMSK